MPLKRRETKGKIFIILKKFTCYYLILAINRETYDIRVKGGDSNSAIRINRNSDGNITYSASARSFTADRISNFFSRVSDFFKEGERQQSTAGENRYLYGDGSPSGWEIPAPHANPDGENRYIDISDMVFPDDPSNLVKVIESLFELYSRYRQDQNPPNRNDTIYKCTKCHRYYEDSLEFKVPTVPDPNRPQGKINYRQHRRN